MYESLSVVTPPVGLAVDLQCVVKPHCRIDVGDTTEDALLAVYVGAATRSAAAYLKQTLLTTQYLLIRDNLPGRGLAGPTGSIAFNSFLNGSACPWTFANAFKILRPPLASIDLIRYRDTAGVWQTLASDQYTYVPGFPGRLAPAYGVIWPFLLPQIGGVEITYTAGAPTVAPEVQAAILLWTGSLYRDREPTDAGILAPTGTVKNLLDSAAKGFYG